MSHVALVFDDIDRLRVSQDVHADIMVSILSQVFINGDQDKVTTFVEEGEGRGYRFIRLENTLILKGHSLCGIRISLLGIGEDP